MLALKGRVHTPWWAVPSPLPRDLLWRHPLCQQVSADSTASAQWPCHLPVSSISQSPRQLSPVRTETSPRRTSSHPGLQPGSVAPCSHLTDSGLGQAKAGVDGLGPDSNHCGVLTHSSPLQPQTPGSLIEAPHFSSAVIPAPCWWLWHVPKGSSSNTCARVSTLKCT